MLASAEEALNINNSVADDKKDAEYYLLNYERELSAYKSAKDEYINYKNEKDSNVGGGKGNMTGNPTEQAALRGMMFDKYYEGYRWLKAVEIVQRGLGERKNIFIRVRREAERNNLYAVGRGRKGWVVYVQQRYLEEIERRFIISEARIGEKTLRSWWQQIIDRTVAIAKEILVRSMDA